jgi:hypothetical protein
MHQDPYESPPVAVHQTVQRFPLRWLILVIWIVGMFGCYLAMAYFSRGRNDSDPDVRALVAMAGLLVCGFAAFVQSLLLVALWIVQAQKQRQAGKLASEHVDKSNIPKILRQRDGL